MRKLVVILVITASIAVSAIVGAHSAQAAPPPPPQFFQDTGLLTTPFPVCPGGDGYSNAHCPVGGSFGSDHAGGR